MNEKIHCIDGYIQSIYLLEGEDGLLLLDSGCRCDVKIICAFITEELHRPLSDLRAVIVTHLHPDHAGGAALLRRRSGCEIWLADGANALYAGWRGRIQYAVDLFLAYYIARKKRRPWRNLCFWPTLYADRILRDAELLPYFSDWQVCHTPGHTLSDISLWHAGRGQLYVADIIISVRRGLISPFPIMDAAAYHESLSRIRAMPVRCYLLAHQGILSAEQLDWQAFSTQAPRTRRTVADLLRQRCRKILGKFTGN